MNNSITDQIRELNGEPNRKRSLVEGVVISAVKETLGNYPIKGNTNLAEVYNMDSLSTINLTMGLEDAFSLAIPDEDIEKMLTSSPGEYKMSTKVQRLVVEDITNYISGRFR